MDQEKIKRYLKANFDTKLYISKHYIKDEKAIIPIHVEKLEDIYTSYGNYQSVLKQEFISYIMEIAYYIPYEYSIVLEFEGIKFTIEEKENLVKNISEQLGLITHDTEIELKYNARKALKLFLIGSMILLLSFIIRNVNYTLYFSEIISIIGTFSLWEFVDTVWFDRRKKKIDKMNAGQLSTCTVVFKEI